MEHLDKQDPSKVQLNEPEQKFSALIINTEEPFVIVDPDLNIAACSLRFQNQYSLYFGGEFKKGTSILDYALSRSAGDLKKLLREVLNGHLKETELHTPAIKEKESRIFSIKYKPAFDEEKKIIGVFITVMDITDKLRSERLFQENENRFKAFVERISDAFIAFDRSLHYTYVNQKACEMAQRSAESLIGKYIWDVFPDAVGSATYLACEKAMKEQVYVTNTGYYAPLDLWHENHFYPSADGLSLFIRDISQQKRAEEKIRQSESNLRTIFENSADGFMLLDASGVIQAFNGQANQNAMLDFPADLQVGKSIYDYITENKKENFSHFINRVLEGETIQYDVEYPKKQSGSIWFHVAMSPIKQNSKVVGICVTRSDITDRKNSEKELIQGIERDLKTRKVQELEQENLIQELTQNNSDLRQFSYITSHNLRGPIASLLGLCSLLENYTIEDHGLQQILDGVKKATVMFDETIRDLTTVLNIRDRRSIPKEDLTLLPIYEKVLAQSEILVNEAGATIKANFEKAPIVNYNKAYMESIFSNLITNAIKYRSPARKLKINITTENAVNSIVMKFSDNGLGIDTELNKEKIFKLYQRFHEHAEGKGLGLFLIKSQLEALNGSIDIESKVGEGTTFILKFRK